LAAEARFAAAIVSGGGEETELRAFVRPEHRDHQRRRVDRPLASRREVAEQRGHGHRSGTRGVDIHVG
jgi:hypothetical protein